MSRIQLQEYASVQLDASGNGRAILGPAIVRERWAPTQATVSVSTNPLESPTNALESRCSLYLGIGGVPGRLLGESRTGSSGDTYGFGGFELQPGQNIVAVWTGGDPNATATITVFGERVRGE